MADLRKVSVVIPFYQREAGILRKGLRSVLGQELPIGVLVHVIVVDDGSPVSARAEAEGLDFSGAFSLAVIEQKNGGVGTARNTALNAVAADTDVIAFLDSDDEWAAGHLAQGIAALAQGNDFYFTDNARDDHHASHFSADTGLIVPFIKAAGGADLIALTREDISTLILRDFPCQVSTTLFRYSIARDLRFDTRVRNAGEDVLFFLDLVSRAEGVCFSTKAMVRCGRGINLYFSNMGWGCEGYLKRLLDDTYAHEMLAGSAMLSEANKIWNKDYVAGHQRQVVFFVMRYVIKHKKLPPEFVAAGLRVWLWFPRWILYVVAGRVLGFYTPF